MNLSKDFCGCQDDHLLESDFQQMNIFELIASLKKLVQSFGKKSASFRST
jgi:hypothetical protein